MPSRPRATWAQQAPPSAPASPKRRHAVLYARVSSKDQEREGFSIPAQQRLLHEYAERNGLDIVEEFVDVETAKRTGRTNYVRMLAWLKRNNKTCNTLLVEKTDRLYRNLKDWVNLDGGGLEIHLVKEGTVLSDEARSSEKFMHGIRVLMAKNYIDNLSEEATKGMLEKAQQGLWPTKAPLGYRNVEGQDGRRTIEVDTERAPLVVKLFEWVAQGGCSLQQATDRARQAGLRMRKSGNIVGKASIHRILRNPLYCGEIVWHGESYPSRHPALVSRELWDRVQDAIDGRNQHQRDKDRCHEFAFSGLVTCAHCGCALSGQIQKERYVYYHCTGFKGDCGEPYVREEVLAEQFAGHLRVLRAPDTVMEWLKRSLRESHGDQERFHTEAVACLEGECARLQRRIEAAYLDKLDGVIDLAFFEGRSAEWRAEQRELRRQIVKHEQANQVYLEDGLLLLDLGREAGRSVPRRDLRGAETDPPIHGFELDLGRRRAEGRVATSLQSP
ncbi:MAG: recombinase family protein [Pseudomonadota bacterium]